MKFSGSCPWAPCLVFVQPEGSRKFDLLHHVKHGKSKQLC